MTRLYPLQLIRKFLVANNGSVKVYTCNRILCSESLIGLIVLNWCQIPIIKKGDYV